MSAAAAAPAGEAAPKKGNKKLIIIVAAAVLLLAAIGGGAVFMMKKKAADEEAAAAGDGEEETTQVEKKKPKKEHKKDDKKVLPVFVPLEPFVVNLADREADRFAQIGLTLQVEDAHAGDEIKAYLPAIRNNILLLLAHKTATELMEADGKEKLARQILRVSALPMGIELEDEDAAAAEAEAEAAAANGPGKKKKKKAQHHYDSIEDSPIKSVQFSSFIIQ
jgi:flagellar FliL protein